MTHHGRGFASRERLRTVTRTRMRLDGAEEGGVYREPVLNRFPRSKVPWWGWLAVLFAGLAIVGVVGL